MWKVEGVWHVFRTCLVELWWGSTFIQIILGHGVLDCTFFNDFCVRLVKVHGDAELETNSSLLIHRFRCCREHWFIFWGRIKTHICFRIILLGQGDGRLHELRIISRLRQPKSILRYLGLSRRINSSADKTMHTIWFRPGWKHKTRWSNIFRAQTGCGNNYAKNCIFL